MLKKCLTIILILVLSIYYAYSHINKTDIDTIKSIKNDFGLSTSSIFSSKDRYGFRVYYQRFNNKNISMRFEGLYNHRFIPISTLIQRSELIFQPNKNVKVSPENENTIMDDYNLFSGMLYKKEMTPNCLFLGGIFFNLGIYNLQTEFSGYLDSLTSMTPISNYGYTYTFDQFPFSFKRNNTFLRTGLSIFAGFEYFFTKRFSISVTPTIYFDYFFLYETTTKFSGTIQYPAEASKSYRQIKYENFFPYFVLHF